MARRVASEALRTTKRPASTWERLASGDEKVGLTSDRIVAAAMEIADERGLSAVSIRNVAIFLGSSPMALYHHLSNKQDLLNLMLDSAHGDFNWDPGKTATWRDALLHLAREMRRWLKLHPWMTEIRAGNPEHGPQYMRVFNSVLERLSSFGLAPGIASRIVGSLFVLANGFRATASGAALPPMSMALLERGEFPYLLELARVTPRMTGDEMFETAVGWMLDGMADDLHLASGEAVAADTIASSGASVHRAAPRGSAGSGGKNGR